MALFHRSRPAPTHSGDVESMIRSIGGDLLDLARSKSRGLLSGKFWSDKLMDWAMRDPGFKTQLFRFVDVMPVLKTPEQIHRHLTEYLSQPGVNPPPFLKLGIAAGSLLKGTLAKTVISQIESMAARFVAGTDAAAAMPALRELWDEGAAFSVDLLGEACVSDAEAEAYVRRYQELLDTLPREVAAFADKPVLQSDHLGPIPRANVSVKISSLSARISPADFEGTLRGLQETLTPLLKHAATNDVFVNFDMEQHELKELTIALFKRCCEAIDFPAGLAMQAYLRSGREDAADLIGWAKRSGRQVSVRLIKGAYWDYEVTHAGLMNWPSTVWQHKAETDACFEAMSEAFVSQIPTSRGEGGVKLAIGSHNLRSIAHALALVKHRGLPDNAVELQMLRGMADELKAAVIERGYRLREYVPIGQMLPGMAYLVRRLLENTSNESWLRAGFKDVKDTPSLLTSPDSLLAVAPKAHVSDAKGFHNEPWRDFSDNSQREAFHSAIRQASVPSVRNLESIDRVVTQAHEAFPTWRDRSATERSEIIRAAAQIMRSRRDELAGVIIRESAKPWREADADVCEAIDFCEYYAREATPLLTPRPLSHLPGEDNRYWHEARGVTAVISPWNFPQAICCGMTVASLVTGNCAIVKPAEQSPGIAKLLCEMLWEAGVPRDVLHFAPGVGETVGAALVRHPLVANIAFTGSKAVGLQILREAAVTPDAQGFVKRVICEMGGKNAIIVDASADVDEAVLGVRYSAFGYSGQKCSACSRVIVLEENYESFVTRLVESAKALKVGGPLDPGTDLGPVIDDEAVEKIRRYVEIGHREAKVELAIDGQGRYVGPHIFSIDKYDLAHPPRIATQEIFGPVLTVIRARDLDEALRIANSSTYKLTGGLFSRTPWTIERVRREFRVGNLYINRGITGALVGRQPFGGFGLSGVGAKAGGPDYLRQFTDSRVCTENTLRRGFVPENA
jgi:RHH-type proline utilization regulon transcriptional repressor/proline dehydrogenase/delta 1-pyrroline-5-carboxylate dehydrogenase